MLTLETQPERLAREKKQNLSASDAKKALASQRRALPKKMGADRSLCLSIVRLVDDENGGPLDSKAANAFGTKSVFSRVVGRLRENFEQDDRMEESDEKGADLDEEMVAVPNT